MMGDSYNNMSTGNGTSASTAIPWDYLDAMAKLLNLSMLAGEGEEGTDERNWLEVEKEKLLSGTRGYTVTKSSLTQKKSLMAAQGDDASSIVLAGTYELAFLSALDALPDCLSPGAIFRVLPISAVENLEHTEDGKLILDSMDIICDTRTLGLFEQNRSRSSIREYAYTGSVSNKKAAAVHKLVLCTEGRMALSKLMSGNGSRHYFDMGCGTAEKIANELFCGKAHLALANRNTKPVPDILTRFNLLPFDNPKVCEETRTINLVGDVSDVWLGYVKMMGCDTLPEAVGAGKQDKTALPSWGTIASWLAKFREMSGVEAGVDALLDGVPVEDIIS